MHTHAVESISYVRYAIITKQWLYPCYRVKKERKHFTESWLNGFDFISNDNIAITHLWKDGIRLEDLATNILAGNFADFMDRFILSKSSEHSWLYTDKHLKGLYGNTGVLMSDNSLSPEIVSDISNLVSLYEISILTPCLTNLTT